MKRMIGIFLMLLGCFSFVFAVSSEVEMNFAVGDSVSIRPVTNYVPPESFAGDYLGYFSLVFVALVLVYFVVRQKKVAKKKVSKKKVAKRKKVSSKKAKKK